MSSSHRATRSAPSPHGLARQVQRLARPAAAGELQFGAAGWSFAPPPPTALALFELTTAMVHPTAAQQAADADNGATPRAYSARMLHWVAGAGNFAPAGQSAACTLYFPCALRDTAGNYVGTLPLAAGGRCYAWWNRQAGRWEVIARPELLCRFEMTAALNCGGSAQALGYLMKASPYEPNPAQPPAQTITVYDLFRQFSKMASLHAADAGARGLARYMPDAGRWEILALQTPGDFWGKLASTLSDTTPYANIEVLNGAGYDNFDWVAGGYNPFQNVKQTIAYNPRKGASPNFTYWHWGAAGDIAYCRWDIRQGKYYVLAVSPNAANWPSLDVVTAVNFQTQKFATRQIKLPPWTAIGGEVQH